jgi:hypothetical protein
MAIISLLSAPKIFTASPAYNAADTAMSERR